MKFLDMLMAFVISLLAVAALATIFASIAGESETARATLNVVWP